jgi:hypothetical protein
MDWPRFGLRLALRAAAAASSALTSARQEQLGISALARQSDIERKGFNRRRGYHEVGQMFFARRPLPFSGFEYATSHPPRPSDVIG